MYKSLLNLDEKTIVIAGPLSAFHKLLALQFLELGSDVILIHNNLKDIPRFTQNLKELNSVKPNYGRIADISSPLEQPKDIVDVITHSAELFGSVDIYIDTHSFSPQGEKSRELMTEKVLEFLKGRRRGRLVYCVPDTKAFKDDRFPKLFTENLQKKIKEKTKLLKDYTITINALLIGPTEEYLLNRFPEKKSIQDAITDLNKKLPEAKIVNDSDIAKIIIFLASPMSTALNGQSLSLNYGLY